MMSQKPFPGEEPSADMREFASNMRQMFVALVQEGFTEPQATHMVGVVISATLHRAKPGGDR